MVYRVPNGRKTSTTDFGSMDRHVKGRFALRCAAPLTSRSIDQELRKLFLLDTLWCVRRDDSSYSQMSVQYECDKNNDAEEA